MRVLVTDLNILVVGSRLLRQPDNQKLANLARPYHPERVGGSVDVEISGFAGDQSLVSADTQYQGG